MNTEFTFYEDGVEKKGNLVIAFQVEDLKFLVYQLVLENGEVDSDNIYVSKYFEESEKPTLYTVTDEELEKIKNRLNVILNEIN